MNRPNIQELLALAEKAYNKEDKTRDYEIFANAAREAVPALCRRVLELEAVIEKLKTALEPFSDKATKWESNHERLRPPRDSTQIQHRLGDFRIARAALKEPTP